MADNYIERQYEQYEARKAAWEKFRKQGKKKTTRSKPQPEQPAENTIETPRRMPITGGADGIGEATSQAFRTSENGSFESVILDPDGNRIECVYKKEQKAIPTETRMIETERLILRPFTEYDAEAFFACCRNPNLGNNAGWKPHETREESLKILQTTFITQKNIWAITNREDQQLIGSVGIMPDPKRENPNAGMIGYWLDETQWGKGYMSEAVSAVLKYGFNQLGLTLISANCYPHNERSQQVLKRQGFIYEGILHQAEIAYDGKIYDHLCYYLKKEDSL